MPVTSQQQLLRIFINEADSWKGQPLYRAIVQKLQEKQFAGCTVVRGVEGFGQSRAVHTSELEVLMLDLPVIVETVDTEEKMKRIIPELDGMIKVGLMTLEKIDVASRRAE